MEPKFEIIDNVKHYKIYENGLIEGFSGKVAIFNRIHQRLLNQLS